jgi:translation elongation factor EF-G
MRKLKWKTGKKWWKPILQFIRNIKTSVESHVGEITYFKVMSGKITEGLDLINSKKQATKNVCRRYLFACRKNP